MRWLCCRPSPAPWGPRCGSTPLWSSHTQVGLPRGLVWCGTSFVLLCVKLKCLVCRLLCDALFVMIHEGNASYRRVWWAATCVVPIALLPYGLIQTLSLLSWGTDSHSGVTEPRPMQGQGRSGMLSVVLCG
jgi:hypothetical protein